MRMAMRAKIPISKMKMIKRLLPVISIILIIPCFAQNDRKKDIPSDKKEKNAKKEIAAEVSKDEPVEITGDRLEYKSKQQEAIYSGHVVLIHGDMKLTCDLLHAYGEKKEKIVGEGNVKWAKKKDNVTLTSDYFQYESKDKFLIAEKKPVLIMYDKNNIKTVIVSKRMEMYGDKNEAIGIDDVVITREDTKATCQRAHYFDKEGKLILTGKPVVEQKKNIFKGDVITVYLEDEKIILDKNVDTVIYPDKIQESDEGKKEEIKDGKDKNTGGKD